MIRKLLPAKSSSAIAFAAIAFLFILTFEGCIWIADAIFGDGDGQFVALSGLTDTLVVLRYVLAGLVALVAVFSFV